MKSNDYYGHYKAFVKALSENPDLRLQHYCKENDVIWRRLYDWMSRKHISLKRLYKTYGNNNWDSALSVDEDNPQFCEIIPVRKISNIEPCAQDQDSGSVGMSRIMLPSGVVMELKDCPVSALAVLLNQCLGKEVDDVRS